MSEEFPAFPSIKLHRPRALAGWVVRPRLLERLDQVLQEPVALISAPAGFGKTTLLSQWLDRCPLPNAWLQLDEGDHDIPAFLEGIVAALRQLFPDCLRKTADLLLLSQGSIPMTVWKSTLIDDLALLEDTPCVLALDDYHLVGNPSIDLLLTDVLRSESLSLHLIISARRSPSLSFSKLRVQRRIVEIPTADLRFTDSEAALYFDQAAHLPLSSSAIKKLQVKTEGWAAGLALAAISLREEVQPEDLFSYPYGSDTRVSDYLLDQVFNNQPEEIQEFLIKTATFDHFSAPLLCEAFGFEQGEGEIQALLERIEAAQLFLISLDSQRSFYRYHHLFRQMLLSRQRFYFHPDQIELFHRRAVTWLIRQGQADEALEHLLALRDWTAAAQLVEGQLCTLLNAEDFHAIKQRLAYFSEEFIATRPGLLLMQAWMAHFAVRLPVIRSLTSRIQSLLDVALSQNETVEGSTPPGFEMIAPRIIQAQVWMLDSLCYCLTNQGSEAVPLAWQALEILPETWQFARGNAMLYLALGMLMEGQYHQAVEEITQAFERQHDPSSTYRARLLNAIAILHLLHGELELCRQATEQMLRDALDYNLVLMQSWGYYLLGRVYQEWNQLDLAARYFKQAVDQRFTSNLMPSLESIASYIYILHILGRGEEGQQFLESLEQLHGEVSVMPPMLLSLLAWLKLQDGNREEARRWADSFNVPLAGQAIVWLHFPHIYKAKILMSLGEPEAGQLLAEIQKLAECTHNNFSLIRVLVLRSVWLARQGQYAEAQQILERALRLARPGRFIQAFVKQGPEILMLLKALAPTLQNEPGLAEYAATIIAEFSIPLEAHSASPRQNEFRTMLTERELEVLELLAERLTIQEIAGRLFISPSTVQQHTHHIYRKLNVANKRQAVASAELLGILTPKQ